MRYTEGTVPKYACCESVLQIFSIRVMEIKDGLEWPLHVYGFAATRDSVDYNRDLLFNRTRDDCQILTEEDPHLVLTGPSRAVVFIDPVEIEVRLRVKGKTIAEDKFLLLDILEHNEDYACYNPSLITRHCTSKRSTLEFKWTVLYTTVEATISRVQIIDGSWPQDFRGKVVACTASLDTADIILLDSRDGRMPITCDGEIKLSRKVVSVEALGLLGISVEASQVDNAPNEVTKDWVVYKARMCGESYGIFDLGFCKVGVTVAWSLLATLDDMRLAGKRKTSKYWKRRTSKY
ncbi:hypothetical protein ACP4OV_024258 [Aristida adscensionis]